MYQSITKLPMPPHRPLGIWLFLKGFGQILGYVGSLDGQIPHRLALQKVSNPAFHQRLFMVKNFSMRQTVYSNLNILLNTTEISKSRKTVVRRFFIPITLFISESPHLTGPFKLRANGRNVGSCSPTMLRPFACSFKGSQMLQQNSEYRSNDVNSPWTWCTRWTKPTNILTRKSMPDRSGLILGQIPHCTEKCAGYALGVERFWNWLVNNLTLVRSLVPSLA